MNFASWQPTYPSVGSETACLIFSQVQNLLVRCGYQVIQPRRFGQENLVAQPDELVRFAQAPLVFLHRRLPLRDPPDFQQAFDGYVQCTCAQADALPAKLVYILHDGVAVLRPTSQTEQDEESYFG